MDNSEKESENCSGESAENSNVPLENTEQCPDQQEKTDEEKAAINPEVETENHKPEQCPDQREKTDEEKAAINAESKAENPEEDSSIENVTPSFSGSNAVEDSSIENVTPSFSGSNAVCDNLQRNASNFSTASPEEVQNEASSSTSSGEDDAVEPPTHDSRGKPFYRQPVTLYHYTTNDGARGIRRTLRINENHIVPGRRQFTNHGPGVYFTRWDPGRPTRSLIQNLFVNSGRSVRDEAFFRPRIQHVVRIEFDENDPIVQIHDGRRDLFVHRGDVNLRNYEGRYRIYENPNAT